MSATGGGCLYDSTVAHVRGIAPPLSFAHRMYLWLVDLEVPQTAPGWLRPFARFDGRDHFDPDQPGGIRAELDAWLATRGADLRGGRVLMLASARVLGYVCNPSTVFWCHRPDGALECVVAEVHNTYRGRHAYLLYPDAEGRASVDKEFYVSPFRSIDGRYRMHLPVPGSRLAATVVRTGAAGTALAATVRGVRRPATTRRVVRMLLARPFVPRRVAALIRGHGIGLWVRGAPRPQSISKAGELHG